MLTKEELQHIARIARIYLSEEEIQELLPQFNDILQLLERVKTLPLTEGVVETTENASEFRDDIPQPFKDADTIVEQFPRRRGRYLEVPPNL